MTNQLRPIINACMTEDEFREEVEQFLKRYALTPTTFGLWAMNDSRFVFDLRSGRMCYGRTMRHVVNYMSEYAQKQEARRKRELATP
ncbi:MAG: hypothetical protein AB7G17_00960 [Phycisphaerales bacterium]